MKKTADKEPAKSEIPSAEDSSGVDISLIDWMLSLSPTQRLDVLQANARSLLELRHAEPSSLTRTLMTCLSKSLS